MFVKSALRTMKPANEEGAKKGGILIPRVDMETLHLGRPTRPVLWVVVLMVYILCLPGDLQAKRGSILSDGVRSNEGRLHIHLDKCILTEKYS